MRNIEAPLQGWGIRPDVYFPERARPSMAPPASSRSPTVLTSVLYFGPCGQIVRLDHDRWAYGITRPSSFAASSSLGRASIAGIREASRLVACGGEAHGVSATVVPLAGGRSYARSACAESSLRVAPHVSRSSGYGPRFVLPPVLYFAYTSLGTHGRVSCRAVTLMTTQRERGGNIGARCSSWKCLRLQSLRLCTQDTSPSHKQGVL